jgi:D-3-phosphoglycerate dehydrogenase
MCWPQPGVSDMAYRCAILDDYQNVALKLADWSKITKDVDIQVFTEAVRRSDADTINDCKDFDIVVMMRERTRFPRAVIDGLPKLKLLITTGAYNASIDMKACQERGIVVCGTGGYGNPTTGITFGMILELTRRIGWEHARMKSGVLWQNTLGMDIEGKTLGVLGLGKLGARAAGVGKAFGMKVIAWSQNLTPERCKEVGVEYSSKEDLFRSADVVTIHLVLSDRTRGLVAAKELGLMKKTAYVVNTSRGPIIEEKSLLEALNKKQIAGAGLDVFDVEPLPLEHPYRKMENVVITPHLGYVSQQNYEKYYPDIVEDIRGFLDGKPTRVIAPR